MLSKAWRIIIHSPNQSHFSLTNIGQIYRNITNKPLFCSDHKTIQESIVMSEAGKPLSYVLKKLNQYAPTSLAEPWDNVGLLIEPSVARQIKHILLTNDLTESVVQEAVSLSTEMIISYHPPIFAPLKSVTQKSWKERVVASCLENKIALFSPHTSHDVVSGGVNDWLSLAFDNESVKCINPFLEPGACRIDIMYADTLAARDAILDVENKFRVVVAAGFEEYRSVRVKPDDKEGESMLQIFTSKRFVPQLSQSFHESLLAELGPKGQFQVQEYSKRPKPDHGTGRLCQLKTPTSIRQLVERVKAHLDMPHLRLALAANKDLDSLVSTVALCAGSGGSVLKSVKADIFLTGEMLHHDILDATQSGVHVILTNHSDSERGFLKVFAKNLHHLLDEQVRVSVSLVDKDPLTTV